MSFKRSKDKRIENKKIPQYIKKEKMLIIRE